MNPTGKCPLCNREIELLEHHLIPKNQHEENWFKKNYTPEQLGQVMMVCLDCHNAIHKFYSSRELGQNLNTPDLILADEKIVKFAKFAAKQKGSISQRAPKKKGFNL